MSLTCLLIGHTTVREFREVERVKVLHLVCTRCGHTVAAISRTRQERIDLMKRYRRIAPPRAQRVDQPRSAKVVGIGRRAEQ